jgi:hypothetical protein
MFPGLPNTKDEAKRQEEESSMEGCNGGTNLSNE